MRVFNCKNSGFSLAESLITMLIIVIVVAFSVPVLTKKRKNIEKNAVHGKWACKYIDGQLKHATALNIDAELPLDDKWEDGCTFPNISKSVKFLWVEVYGGGGGGSLAGVAPWIPKEDKYPFGSNGETAPAPRDGEYDLSYYFSNYAGGLYFKNRDNSSDGIFYLNESDATHGENAKNIKKYCLGSTSYFYKPSDDKYTKTYGTCKQFNSCNPNGSGDDYEATDCVKDVKPGYYCYKSELPPHGTAYTDEEMLAECKKGDKEDCEIVKDEKGIPTKVTYSYRTCSRWGLPYASGGAASPSIVGKIKLKKGEYLKLSENVANSNVSGGNVGIYPYSGANGGANYTLYHVKGSSSSSGFEIQLAKVAEIIGGKVGKLDSSSDGCNSSCSSDKPCFNVSGYPNTKTAEITNICAKNGEDGTTVIDDSYGATLYTTPYSVSFQGTSIVNQYFTHYQGCYGENGSAQQMLISASGDNKYNFKVGKGGKGAYVDDYDNPISAMPGSQTYFSWVKASGGKGAKGNVRTEGTSCTTTDVANLYSAGAGGAGGIVKYQSLPEYDYKQSEDYNKEPHGRWEYDSAGDGSSGMIVVSW